VQAASVDEFYLDLTGTERLFQQESLGEAAWRIRNTVLEHTQVSVSIGGGTRRVIAKLATNFAKPAGVHIVPAGEEETFLRGLDLADLPGIGPSLVAALEKRGLVRVEDAYAVQIEWLQRWFGDRRGAWLYRRIRGIDSSAVDPHESRKSISSERTFSEDIDDDEKLEQRLMQQAGSVAGTLREKSFRAKTVTVKLRDHDFKTRQHSRSVPEPIESDQAIYSVAKILLAELRRKRRVPARLLGVGLSGLVGSSDASQLGLFAGETERERKVSRTVDELRRRFGREAVMPGRLVEREHAPRDPKDKDK
jgi:DNA polymerase-4